MRLGGHPARRCRPAALGAPVTTVDPALDAAIRGNLGELATTMGIVLGDLTPELVSADMPVAGNRQPYGLLHGGASAVLAETVGSIHAALVGPEERCRSVSNCRAPITARRGTAWCMPNPRPSAPDGRWPLCRSWSPTTPAAAAARLASPVCSVRPDEVIQLLSHVDRVVGFTVGLPEQVGRRPHAPTGSSLIWTSSNGPPQRTDASPADALPSATDTVSGAASSPDRSRATW